MLKYDVLCVGSATVDHFLTINQPLKSIKLGDKVLVKSIEVRAGGGGTNSAVALSKLRLNVKIFTKLGMDHEAEFINRELKKNKIKNICLSSSKKKTNSSTILFSTKEKDRTIYVHKGASQDLSMQDCIKSDLKTKWIYLASLIGQSLQTAKKLVNYAHKNSIKVLFNPSLYLAKKGKRFLKSILEKTDVLVLNKEEAEALLGLKLPASKLIKKLHYLGPKTVVITCGARNILALNQDKIYSLTPPKIKVVQTTGSGDAFTSGLLAGIIKGYDFKDSLILGQVNAASVIGQVGAKEGLLTLKEASKLMKRYKINVNSN